MRGEDVNVSGDWDVFLESLPTNYISWILSVKFIPIKFNKYRDSCKKNISVHTKILEGWMYS